MGIKDYSLSVRLTTEIIVRFQTHKWYVRECNQLWVQLQLSSSQSIWPKCCI